MFFPSSVFKKRNINFKSYSHWNPSKFIETIAWWTAEEGITLSGNVVTSWEDQVSGYILITGTLGTPRPRLKTLNTRPTVQLDGENDYFYIPSSNTFFNFLHNGDGGMAIVVVNFSSSTGARVIINTGDDQTGDTGIYMGASGNGSIDWTVSNGGGINYSIALTSSANLINDGDPHIMWAELKNNSSEHHAILKVDGTLIGQMSGSNYSLTNANNVFSIGARASNNSRHWGGGVSEIIILSGSLNSSQKNIIEKYLYKKYLINIISTPVLIPGELDELRIPSPLFISQSVAYLLAIDPWVVDNVWSLSQGQISQVMTPEYYQPTKNINNPVFDDGGFGSVYQSGSTWFLWYQSLAAESGSITGSVGLGVATSSNGDEWHYPSLNIYPHTIVRGSGNLCYYGEKDVGVSGPNVMIAPSGANGRNYQWLLSYNNSPGVYLVGSNDGFNWDKNNDVLLHPLAIDSNFVIVPEVNDEEYIIFSRLDDAGGTGEQPIFDSQARRIAITELEHLTGAGNKATQVVYRTDRQEVLGGYHHVYSSAVRKHESGLYIMQPHLFRQPDKLVSGISWSRDARFWERPDIRISSSISASTIVNEFIDFIPVGASGAWDAGFLTTYGNVWNEVEDEWRFYYTGWSASHQIQGLQPGEPDTTPDRRIAQTGYATLRKEGIAAWVGPNNGAVVSTRHIVWPGGDLYINADCGVSGSIQIRVTEPNRIDPDTPGTYDGKLGYKFDDFNTFSGNAVRHEATWTSANISDLAGEKIRLEFYIEKDAKLYSFAAI